jgi:peroxiredoxin
MKTKLFIALVAGCLLATAQPLTAAEANPVETELREAITKTREKLNTFKDSKPGEADLAAEIKAFDTILEKHKGQKTDELAQVLMIKASLYSDVLGNEAKGKELMEQLKKEFPDSKAVAMLKRQEEAEKTRAGLAVGKPFPDFEVKDTAGKPLSLAAYKGKVILLDFWATWCGPCITELPNLLEAYEKHHAAGFEIIGISLDSDRSKLDNFVKQKKMNWPQHFDGKGWQNELAQKYGINSIPATYLLDREGKIIGTGLRGKKLEEAVAAAVAKK